MTSMPKTRMGAPEWAMLAALSILWGGTFLFVAVAVNEIPPLTLVTLRVAIAGAAMMILLRIMGLGWPWTYASIGSFFAMGVLNNVIPFTLIFYGQTQISAGLASILNATTPIFTVLVLHFLTRDERLTPRKIAGVTLGFVGVIVLVGFDALSGVVHNVWAQIACLGATVSYAFALLIARRFRGTPAVAVAAGQLMTSTLMMAPLAFLIDQPWTLPVPTLPAMAAVLALALASTALAYVLYFNIVARAGGTNASLVTLLIPASAILLGMFVLGERISLAELAGLGLILAGLIVIDGRLFARGGAATPKPG
jgi:drug/metabolite transporter (DMT)-like permease